MGRTRSSAAALIGPGREERNVAEALAGCEAAEEAKAIARALRGFRAQQGSRPGDGHVADESRAGVGRRGMCRPFPPVRVTLVRPLLSFHIARQRGTPVRLRRHEADGFPPRRALAAADSQSDCAWDNQQAASGAEPDSSSGVGSALLGCSSATQQVIAVMARPRPRKSLPQTTQRFRR